MDGGVPVGVRAIAKLAVAIESPGQRRSRTTDSHESEPSAARNPRYPLQNVAVRDQTGRFRSHGADINGREAIGHRAVAKLISKILAPGQHRIVVSKRERITAASGNRRYPLQNVAVRDRT